MERPVSSACNLAEPQRAEAGLEVLTIATLSSWRAAGRLWIGGPAEKTGDVVGRGTTSR